MRRRSASLTRRRVARMRSVRLFRWSWKVPRRDRPQMWVNPGRVCLRSTISLHCGLDDLAAGHGHFEPVGSAPTLMKQLDHEGWLLAKFFFVLDPDGCKIEVIQHHDRYWI